MPDIAMCLNKERPLREKCYRFKAKPNPYWQSYYSFEFENGNCKYFILKLENKNAIHKTKG